MNIFTGLMFLEDDLATPPPLDVAIRQWRRKPWRESWEEAAQHAAEHEAATQDETEEACATCG